MSAEDRKAITNGMWLCQNCAKLIDNDENRYTVDLLHRWKRLSEEAALLDIERNAPSLAVGVEANVGKEKLSTYLRLFHLLGLLGKEIDLIQVWTDRIHGDDEIAELSGHFPASGVIERLRVVLTSIEDLRIQRRWLLAWKADALLYAISLKGAEVSSAIEQYGNEKDDWQLKRGHQLAASSIATVVSGYSSMCSREANVDLEQHKSTLGGTPSDDDMIAFFKVLGDMGRAESKRFSDENPELIERLRDSNRSIREKNALDFKYNLLCERLLDPHRGSTFKLTPKQRIWFLEKLYEECLGFYLRIWNEPITEAEEEDQRSRLERMLGMQSTREILSAFKDMIVSIKNTVEQTTPITASTGRAPAPLLSSRKLARRLCRALDACFQRKLTYEY